MTRKDFELIAETIRETARQNPGNVGYGAALEDLACNFATRLRGVNPRFDRARFKRACGVKEAA